MRHDVLHENVSINESGITLIKRTNTPVRSTTPPFDQHFFPIAAYILCSIVGERMFLNKLIYIGAYALSYS